MRGGDEVAKTKYQELWGWQSILEEADYDIYSNDSEELRENVSAKVQIAYDNGEITKEQAIKLCEAMDLVLIYKD